MNINIKETIINGINDSIDTKLKLIDSCVSRIESCGFMIADILKNGGKVLLCGNGGSAADCQHIAAELVIRFRGSVARRALPAIALTVDTSMLTAGANDIGFENVFAREVEAFGNNNDILIGISTSGNSENVIRAINQAKSQGMKTLALLGGNGGKLINMCDDYVLVPNNITARIQESHILIGHLWCQIIEELLFPDLV